MRSSASQKGVSHACNVKRRRSAKLEDDQYLVATTKIESAQAILPVKRRM